MEEIRNHIEENLDNAEKEYNDLYYHWDKAHEAFQNAEVELKSLTVSLEKARINMKYYQKLLKELNEHEKIQ